MVQYPPSMDTADYQCVFRLTARLEDHTANTHMFVQRKVIYMPFLETSLSKAPPFVQQQRDRQLSVKLTTLDYVPGDTIQLAIEAPPSDYTITAKLVRITTFLADGSRDELVVHQERQPCSATSENTIINLQLPLVVDLVPSFSYSKHVAVSYQLQVIIVEHRKKTLTKLLGSAAKFHLPIKLGTLGPGVRAPDSLAFYSTFTNQGEYTPKL